MRIPDSLASLADLGIIEEVVRPLMSGKEAQVYLVIADGEERVAKIYKEADQRSFKHRAEYTEGRKVRNTRDQRAITNRSSHGRAQDEAAWRATEVHMIHRLHAAGVRVPVPYHFIDGVLIMELVTDAEGHPAPRLGDLSLDGPEATAIYQHLLRDVVRMLCAGVVHGDLSDFNVLMGGGGPVLIDFPQSVDAAHNQNARKLLLRDVDNLHDFVARYDKKAVRLPYGEEMWELYEGNQLAPETALTGRYRPSNRAVDTGSVLSLIEEARRDEQRRRETFRIKGGAGAAGRAPAEARPAADPPSRPRPENQPPSRPAQNQQQPRPRQNQQPPRPPQNQQQPRPRQNKQQPRPPQRQEQPRPPQNASRPPQGASRPPRSASRPLEDPPRRPQSQPRSHQNQSRPPQAHPPSRPTQDAPRLRPQRSRR